MRWIGPFVAGILVGYLAWGIDRGVQLYGGVFSSSRLADIMGYANNFAGCRDISAAMNHAQSEKMLTTDFDNKWADAGNFFCKGN